MNRLINFFVIALATWRASRMFYDLEEDGPFDILHKIRMKAGIRIDTCIDGFTHGSQAGRAMLCPYCVSWWVGLAFAILYFISPRVCYVVALPFALSGIVVLFYEHIDPSLPAPGSYPPSRLLD